MRASAHACCALRACIVCSRRTGSIPNAHCDFLDCHNLHMAQPAHGTSFCAAAATHRFYHAPAQLEDGLAGEVLLLVIVTSSQQLVGREDEDAGEHNQGGLKALHIWWAAAVARAWGRGGLGAPDGGEGASMRVPVKATSTG